MIAPELFEPGEYIDRHGPGWFSILGAWAGKKHQRSYELEHLPTVVAAVNPEHDSWITQAVFSQPNRRAVNLQTVGLLFSDLDTYHVPNLAARPPEEQAELLAGFCRAEELPVPSLVLFSGRGLQAKWLLVEALGAIRLAEWNAAQVALVELLAPFAADRIARDISRVLRLDGTRNSKNGERARIVWTASGSPGALSRYDFADMYARLVGRIQVPETRALRPTSTRRPISAMANKFSFTRLNWCRLHDIRRLWQLRGGVPHGFRELTLFWQLNFLLKADAGRDVWQEAQSLAGQIDDSPGWYQQSDLSTLFRKAQAARAGEAVDYAGKKMPALYTPRNDTLINLFGITNDEQRSMTTIISQAEKMRRKREKRWSEGTRPQALSLSRLRPWDEQGISRRTWYNQTQE